MIVQYWCGKLHICVVGVCHFAVHQSTENSLFFLFSVLIQLCHLLCWLLCIYGKSGFPSITGGYFYYDLGCIITRKEVLYLTGGRYGNRYFCDVRFDVICAVLGYNAA